MFDRMFTIGIGMLLMYGVVLLFGVLGQSIASKEFGVAVLFVVGVLGTGLYMGLKAQEVE